MRAARALSIALATACVLVAAVMPFALAATGEPHQLYWFNRCCTQYGPVDDAFGEYLAAVQPQVAVCGYFGPDYYAAVSYARDKGEAELWTPLGGGPVDPAWWTAFIAKAHAHGVKVIGMFSLTGTYGDPEKPAGFFKFFDQQWNAAALGPKPDAQATDLMQRDANGQPVSERVYRIEDGSEYFLCPSNPAWRATMKAMVTAAIRRGVDGFIIVFPKRFDCVCEHCQNAYRKWLAERYTAQDLKQRLGIDDLATYRFQTINGWYEPQQASAYALECLRFSQSVLKDCFDDVFIEHGRKLKPELILGQWNHIYRSNYEGPGQLAGTFAQLNADERCVLATNRWGQGEDFVWYSIGNWSMYDKPEDGAYGEFVLERKYLYEAGGGKPSSIKADDGVRVRLYIAEAAANGGFGYPRGPAYDDPETQKIVKQYFDFLRKCESLYHPAATYAEAALVWNRRAVHRGDTLHTAAFKHLGMLLTKNHVLYDVMLDENLNAERLRKYRLVFLPDAADLTPEQRAAVDDFRRAGGIVVQVMRGEAKPMEGAVAIPDEKLLAISAPQYRDFEKPLDEWLPEPSASTAPDTVALTVFTQPSEGHPENGRFVVHLVNYLRDRKPQPGAKGAALEQPIAQDNIAVRLRLPQSVRAASVKLTSPETPSVVPLAFKQEERSVTFVVPRVLVYAVAVVAAE